MYPWAPENLLEETSIYTSSEQIVLYMKSERPKKCILGRENDRGLKLVPCREDELVCCDESSDPDGPFCYFYTTVFKTVLLRLPLYNFKKELLTEINVALANYIQIDGHLFWVFPSFVPTSAFCHLWGSSYISLRPKIWAANYWFHSTSEWESIVITLPTIL